MSGITDTIKEQLKSLDTDVTEIKEGVEKTMSSLWEKIRGNKVAYLIIAGVVLWCLYKILKKKD